MTAERLGLYAIAESRDERPPLRDRVLHRGQLERGAMALLAVPDLGDPERIGIRRIGRDDLAQAAGHLSRPGKKNRRQGVPVAGRGTHFSDQTVHLTSLN